MNKKNPLSKIFLYVFAAANIPLFAGVKFASPTINGENKIIYTVDSQMKGSPSYTAAFIADAADVVKNNGKTFHESITCFPEKMELVNEGKALHVRNRFGTASYDIEKDEIRWISKAKEIPSESNRLGPSAVSPDGKWTCYIRKNSVSSGPLILRNNRTLTEVVLNSHADFSYEEVPAKWSGDSSAVVYEKDGIIYFCEPKSAFERIQLTEQYRKIGFGTLNSVNWAGNRSLIYVERDIIYKINAKELFTRGLYAPVVGVGDICGRLPVNFNCATDKFWINPQADSLLLIQANAIVTSMKISTEGNSYVEVLSSSPFKDVRGSVLNFEVFWDVNSFPILWVNILSLEDGTKRCSVYQMTGGLKLLMSMGDIGKPVVSPDNSKVAFSAGTTLYVYDVAYWKNIARLNGEKMHSYVWSGNSTIYAGGRSTVRRWDLTKAEITKAHGLGGIERVLFLSSIKYIGWVENTSPAVTRETSATFSKIDVNTEGDKPKTKYLIVAQTPDYPKTFYQYDEETKCWTNEKYDPLFSIPSPNVQNGRYRVFAGTTQNAMYENALYVRNLVGKSTTIAVYPKTVEPHPNAKKVSLIFDACESADGLPRILDVLSTYNLKATFFINGEFIRRYPAETNQIFAAGHECASMFFTSKDLTQDGFVIDDEFIIRGLGRNEDNFFEATGKELSLLWHAPEYKATEKMKIAALEAGYTYVDAGNLSFDTGTFEDVIFKKKPYLSSSTIIDKIMENVSDRSVIPVTVGLPRGKRDDYLYEKLDLLISGLLDNGYEIVNVKENK